MSILGVEFFKTIAHVITDDVAGSCVYEAGTDGTEDAQGLHIGSQRIWETNVVKTKDIEIKLFLLFVWAPSKRE